MYIPCMLVYTEIIIDKKKQLLHTIEQWSTLEA